MTGSDLVVSWLSLAGGHFDAFGMLGLCLGFVAGTMPHRRGILVASAACSGCFGLHFLHLGALTGTAMCAVSVVQSLTSVFCLGSAKRSGVVAPIYAATSLAAASLTLATWNGPASGFAALGALLATCARLQIEAGTMRRLFLAASLCWAGHNLIVGSVFALTCDVLTISGLVIALMREGGVPSALVATVRSWAWKGSALRIAPPR